jgi:hypothetical protein
MFLFNFGLMSLQIFEEDVSEIFHYLKNKSSSCRGLKIKASTEPFCSGGRGVCRLAAAGEDPSISDSPSCQGLV